MDVPLVHGPRTGQCVVDGRYDVMHDLWIGLVAIDTLLEDGLVVKMERQAGFIVSAWPLEAAGLDFEHIVGAVAVLVDPLADRVARERRINLPGPVATVGKDTTEVVIPTNQ